jgi:glycosyltransferase involved in cell wall biosynthesis
MDNKTENEISDLPRILYYGDCPVEPTSAGAILLYRLFESWPREKLLICSPSKKSDCTLQNATILTLPKAPLERLFRSRYASHWATLLSLWNIAKLKINRGQPIKFAKTINQFQPEAIITIGVAGAWMAAAALAKAKSIPLHMIVHDEGHYNYFWVRSLKKFGTSLFAKAYRQAEGRFCISPQMAKLYKKRFGAEGTVLYPFRGRGDKVFPVIQKPADNKKKTKRVFYAGSIYGRGFHNLEKIAKALHPYNAELIAYTPSNPGALKTKYLKIRSAIPSCQLIQAMHKEADALLLWSAFEAEAREAVQSLFPSKMVDYTAAAVPIVVVAPHDACISDYIKTNPDVGYLINNPDPDEIAKEIVNLLKKTVLLEGLAKGAVKAGMDDFSFEKNFGTFKDTILKSQKSFSS